jgi:reticulon-4-interacting protein 1, mitochondrial
MNFTDSHSYPEILRASVEINCSARDLYEFLKNFENYEKWFPGIVQMRSADDLPHGTVGKRYNEIAWVPPGKEEQITVEVVKAESEHHLAIHASLEPFKPRFDYRVEAISPHAVRFHWLCRARGRSLKAFLARPIMRKVLRPRLALAMQRLKAVMEQDQGKLMQAVQIRRFGDASTVNIMTKDAFQPVIKADEILVNLHASSVNHIDVQRRKGYGAKVFALKKAGQWPITLGTDFSGVVAAVGSAVTRFKPGDEVLGAKPPSAEGSFAQYIAVKHELAITKPRNLTWNDAAALPYAFITAWTALVSDAKLQPNQAQGKRVFVQGGAGAVGLMAGQMAKAWGAYVAISCGSEDIEFAQSQGFDEVIDRHDRTGLSRLQDFDVALCTADSTEMPAMLSMLKKDSGATFVTVVHPTLKLTDELGLLKGIMTGKKQLKAANKVAAQDGKRVAWTLYKSSATALSALIELQQKNKVCARIDSTYKLTDLSRAQQRLESGAARGKVVIEMII